MMKVVVKLEGKGKRSSFNFRLKPVQQKVKVKAIDGYLAKDRGRRHRLMLAMDREVIGKGPMIRREVGELW